MTALRTYRGWMRLVAAAVIAVAGNPAPAGFAQVISSPHGDVRIELKCADCHTSAGWSPLREQPAFDHAEQTGFPLLGMHETAMCTSCHTDLRFDRPQTVAEDCASCHVDVHQGALADLCVDCHSTDSFSDVDGLAVHARSLFPLEGAHVSLTCETCHEDDLGGAFSALPTACIDCHADDAAAAQMPDHSAPGFPVTCLDCHTQSVWTEAEFDHGTASEGFELLGAHEVLACASCHVPGTNEPIFDAADDLDCIACHRADYDDEHAGTGFPVACLDCHTTSTFSDATFDHATVSEGFELLGAHEVLACASCHVPGTNEPIFDAADDLDCIACHRADYDDEHGGTGFPVACLDCHTTSTFEDAVLDHAAASGGFELLGKHAEISCTGCHIEGSSETIFQPSSDLDCIACHQADYDDKHGGENTPTTCIDCHNTWDWDDADG